MPSVITGKPSVPDLEPHCGSWVVVNRETGRAVCEVFSRVFVESINQDRYLILTAAQWLARFNAEAKPDAA
jgi:hypothetical protein